MAPSQLRILVPLRNPATEEGLVRLAAALAIPPWGELHLTHVVTDKSPSRPELDAQLRNLADIALDMDVGAIAHVEQGGDVTAVITDALSRWNCNTMVMGWKADVQREAILAASHRALAKAGDVDTLIFKDRGLRTASRISIPTGGGSHAMMGLQIAHDLAARWESELDVIRIARNSGYRADDPLLSRYCGQLRDDTQLQLRMLGIEAPVRIIPHREVVAPIIERVTDSDLVVLGASNDWRQDAHLGGSIPDEIASQTSCSVLMVRAAGAERNSLREIFFENTIRLNLQPGDKWEAITMLVEALAEEKQIPASERAQVLDRALDRERTSATGMGHGTAIPHAPIPDLPGIIGCMAICPQGVDFGGPTDEPTRFVFLLLTPQQNYRHYIPVLSQIAALIRPESTRGAMLSAQTPREVAALIRDAPLTRA